MSKKQDAFYFNNFIECANHACRASELLESVLSDFKPDEISQKLDEMHQIEHSADLKKHELQDVLVKAFITPIDREDISHMSQNIDEITDKLEDVMIRLYYNQVRAVRPDALELARVVTLCCREVKALLEKFADFKHEKSLREHIIKINSLEEQADKLYIRCMYDLHGAGADALEVIAWREIYTYLEKCADATEHAADVVETVVMKNS